MFTFKIRCYRCKKLQHGCLIELYTVACNKSGFYPLPNSSTFSFIQFFYDCWNSHPMAHLRRSLKINIDGDIFNTDKFTEEAT